MNVTLRQMSYFNALSEQRHFGRAAEIMNISQPALSVQIREMESNLGEPLVERRARDVVLTPFGRRILVHVKRMLAEVQAMGETARWRDGLAGRLNLGVIPTIAPYILPDALAALRSDDISLDVHVREGKTERLAAMLVSGELDAAIMALPLPGDALEAAPLFEDRFLLAGNATRLASLGAQVDVLRPDGLGHAPLLLLEDGHCLTDQALDLCGRDRSQQQIDMGASSLPTLSRLVAAGFGLTLMPELAAPTECRAAPDMQLVRFSAPEPHRVVGLVRRAGSGEDNWFAQLASLLEKVGRSVLAQARADIGRA